jgi:hypothetical protein
VGGNYFFFQYLATEFGSAKEFLDLSKKGVFFILMYLSIKHRSSVRAKKPAKIFIFTKIFVKLS